MTVPPKPIAHGTRGGYTNRKCRCLPCVRANADYQKVYMTGFRAAKRLSARPLQSI